nr:immunoglobulin light chain junction region [Macaca mulatta]MOW34471.1 immunoglobulin light chain junction region [Macaca mulatta]MOW34687.1 immunoglobulin light chain junction region [Macaca mulatta]MOW34814.1 immunoglobulin light chain junction region [Macaca mulatta]MOW35218.1 immunoglobulin light chain junction region [Macaca mulatta]
CQQGFNTPYSF